ncbi:myotubularin-related protein 2-like [Ctenocephalides felis]|uniref:myotubularin-related protein 2-like n=1 Tax=Ctenocephalides felis TaxID=7515 RepID=UPI000E6E2783|nr:myotubularin-related protein 2-like [Ctenocephalides felis]
MDKRASTDLINTEMYVISPSKNVSSDSLDSDSKSSSLNSKHNNELAEDAIPLISGEMVVSSSKDVTYLCPYSGPARGTLSVTNYKLYFKAAEREHYILDVPLGVVSRIEKVGGASSRGENSYGIEVFCKDMRNLRFAHKQELHSRRSIFERLQQYAFPLSHKTSLFAFTYKEQLKKWLERL